MGSLGRVPVGKGLLAVTDPTSPLTSKKKRSESNQGPGVLPPESRDWRSQQSTRHETSEDVWGRTSLKLQVVPYLLSPCLPGTMPTPQPLVSDPSLVETRPLRGRVVL